MDLKARRRLEVVEKRVYTDSAAPTTGHRKVGDRCYNSSPAVGQPTSWVCTVAGWPGTWLIENSLSLLEDTNGMSYWAASDDAGFPYGSMYTNSTIAVTIASSSTPTEIGDTWTTGEVNGVTFGASHYLVTPHAGRYKIDWSLSIAQNSPSASIQCEQGIMINGSAVNPGRAHRTIANGSDVGNSGGTTILDLAASDQISLYVENQTNTTNIDVEHGNLAIFMVGGT